LIANTPLSSLQILRELDALLKQHGPPAMMISDNENDLTSMAVLNWFQHMGIDCPYIALGKSMRDTALVAEK